MKRRQSGQALIETALVLPLLLLLTMAVIAIMVRETAQQKLNGAVSLAAAAAAAAPVDQTTSRKWAQDSFDGTIQGYAYVRIDGLENSAPYTCRRESVRDTRIRCRGRATLVLRETPMAFLLVDLPMVATAEAEAPALRSR